MLQLLCGEEQNLQLRLVAASLLSHRDTRCEAYKVLLKGEHQRRQRGGDLRLLEALHCLTPTEMLWGVGCEVQFQPVERPLTVRQHEWCSSCCCFLGCA